MNSLSRSAVVFVAATLTDAAAGSVLHVDADAAPGGNGASWASAFVDLADALDVAIPGTQIWVREGTYRPDRGTGIRSESFELRAGVSLLGGFAGGESSPLDRDPAAHPTILSGDLLGNDGGGLASDFGDNSYHVVTAILLAEPAIVDGFTIVGGNANGFLFHARGGGLTAVESTVNLLDCRLQGNVATRGGAVSANGGTIILIDSLLIQNLATLRGGALESTGALVISTATDWLDNAAIGTGGVSGGAIHLSGGAVSLADGVFAGNSATDRGGSIYVTAGGISIANVSFLASTSGGEGGAVGFANSAPASISASGCWFEACGSDSSSGGAVNAGITGAVTFSQCVFRSNVADTGGALVLTGAADEPALIEGCVFEANSATPDRAGALWLTRTGGSTVRDCLFRDNKATTKGAAMLVTGVAEIVDSHFEGNIGNNGGSIYIPYGGGHAIAVRGCTFLYNESLGSGSGTSGILSDPGIPTLATIVVEDSWFEANGGAVSLSSCFGALRRCTFVANGAGACMLSDTALGVVACDFVANEASGGAALRISTGAPKVIGCRFLGNKSTSSSNSEGGAVMLLSTTPLIADCLFSGNSAVNRGGAIFSRTAGTATVRNCTFAGNTCPTTGDAIALDGTSIDLANCVLWGNGGATQPDQILALFGGSVVVNSSSVQGWTGSLGGSGNNGLNPLFVSPQGVDALVGTLDDDLHLFAGSPSIDSGSEALLPADVADLDGDGDVLEPLPLDLDGNARIVNIVDRGAYEAPKAGSALRKRPRPPQLSLWERSAAAAW